MTTTRIITLELTQDEANMCLEAVITERIRFRQIVDQRRQASPRALANMDALDYLASTLKAKIRQRGYRQ